MTKSFNDVIKGNFTGPAERPPVELLNELRSSLAQKVNYRISFNVASSTSNDRAWHTLRAEVRRIDYVLDLVSVSHKVLQLYPARVSGILSPIREAQNEGELFDQLVEAFNSEKAEETLGTLMKQA